MSDVCVDDQRINERSVLKRLKDAHSPICIRCVDGKEISGTVDWNDVGNVALKLENGRVVVVPRSNILRMYYTHSAIN